MPGSHAVMVEVDPVAALIIQCFRGAVAEHPSLHTPTTRCLTLMNRLRQVQCTRFSRPTGSNLTLNQRAVLKIVSEGVKLCFVGPNKRKQGAAPDYAKKRRVLRLYFLTT